MHSSRFLTGVALSVALAGAVSLVDLALDGQRADPAVAGAAGPSRLVAPALSESSLDSVSSRPDAQGFNIGGGALGGSFQGGGFNIGGGGFQVGAGSQLGGGFQLGAGSQLGGGFQVGGAN